MRRFFLAVASAVSIMMLIANASCSKEGASALPSGELDALDRAISHYGEYKAARQRHVDSLMRLRAQASADPRRCASLDLSLADATLSLNADSALDFCESAIRNAARAGDDSLLLAARIAQLNALASAGFFNIAEKHLTQLESEPVSGDQLAKLLTAARSLYSYMYYYATDNYKISSELKRKTEAYDDSLLRILPPGDVMRRFISAEKSVSIGDFSSAANSLDSLLNQFGPQDHIYGMAAYQRALVYKNLGDEHRYAEYMAHAAESDVMGCIGEGLALYNLANWLYAKGDLDAAFRYINFAMQQATISNARMRAVNIAKQLPVIDESYRHKIDKSRTQLIVELAISVVLLILALVFLARLMSRRRKMKLMNRRLTELSRVQESHLANFLALCSTYSGNVEYLTQLVVRKLQNGQQEELIKILRSGKYTSDHNEDFYEIFDRAFLEIYPDFIEKFNALLHPGERFEMRTDGGIPAEIRIYALVRMGISESVRISQILHYSVNTVYAYRNKVRNRAIDRENFEADVAKI